MAAFLSTVSLDIFILSDLPVDNFSALGHYVCASGLTQPPLIGFLDRGSNHSLTLAQSQAFRANGTIYVSGQIPADNNGTLCNGTTDEKKTAFVFKNIQAVLEAARPSYRSVTM
jgi:enamine deaminase RidA (YjgF/YER057c/UK114 family)